MTVAVATNVSEEVSLQQSQEMIMSIFSCVGYLRDLFPEESFQDHKVAGMNLKSFRRGKDRRTDQLLSWIEQGCFDALSKKYLKQAILTILSDAPGPNNVLETYTLRVTYPSSSLHQGIDASMSKLSLSRNDQPVLSLSATSFTDAMAKILRSLCVMSQTLQALPQRKYLSMKLVYYEEVTPAGYEPPGFQAADFELEHLFVAPSVKYSFGKALNSNHGIALNMETTLSDNVPAPKLDASQANTIQVNGDNLAESMVIEDKKPVHSSEKKNDANEKNGAKEKKSGETKKASESKSTADDTKPETKTKTADTKKKTAKAATNEMDFALASQTAQAALSPPAFPLSQPYGPTATTAATAATTPCDAASSVQSVRCSCGVNKQALEMLQCSSCSNWQHTVCVGFISRKDRRLESRDPESCLNYRCYHCRFGEQQMTFRVLENLSLLRKGIVVLSAEGYNTLTQFTTLMELDRVKATEIRDRLIREGFLRPSGRGCYRVKNGDETVKAKIKYFFHQNLSIFPEFLEAQRADGVVTSDENDANAPKMTKKRQNPSSTQACANLSTFNEDFMSQTPIVNRHALGTTTPPSSTKKLKMSVPNSNIVYE